MSEQPYSPERIPTPPTGEESSPPSPAVPASSPPATTTDLNRFPEKPETIEVTTFLGPNPSPERIAPAPAPSAPAPKSEAPSEPGLDFDPQIKIERKIGAGGMGEVFLGYQKHLDRKVAVKRIRTWEADAQSRDRFIQEAKAQSRLGQHPGIAQVYDFRESGDSLYLIMEYVEGRTLEELQAKEAKFSPDRIVRIGVQLTEALEFAAHEGYIHRDLKPGNVILTEGDKVKIIDFGLALRFRNLIKTRFTQKGDILGTPAYMSPEQLNQEEELDVRSDVWSLGILLYALGTGRPPFTGKDFACTLRNVMIADPAPLPTIEQGFPEVLWLAIARALKKDRAERWQDYASFREALLQCTRSSESTPGTTPGATIPGDGTVRPARSRLLAWSIAAVGLIVVVLIVQALRGAKEAGKEAIQKPTSTELHAIRGSSPEFDSSGKAAAPGQLPEGSIPTQSTANASIDKRELSQPLKSEQPPRLRLRDQLIASPPSAGAIGLVEALLLRFERHSPEIAAFSYENLATELVSLEKSVPLKPASGPEAEDRNLFASYLRAAQKMVGLARGALRARLEELRASKGPVTLMLRAGGTVTGTIELIGPSSITLKGDGGQSTIVELERLSPDEFRPTTAPEASELAFQTLSISATRAFPAILDLEQHEDEAFLWIPVAVRLARLEVEAKARQAATEAKPLLLESGAPEKATDTLLSWTAAKAGEEVLEKNEGRIPAAYGFLSPEFAKAKRELEALELLFHRQFSRAAALYPSTSSKPVAGALQLELFEKNLAAASDELLEGSGWFNWRWELRPTHPDVKERRKYLVPKPDEETIVLQDEEGPRSLVMNDITSRAPEGVFLRLRLDPLGNRPEAAEWRFHLLSEKGGSGYFRVAGGQAEVYRSTLTPGGSDVRLAQAPLPAVPVEQRFRTFTLIPGPEHLHIYVDRQLVLSIPRDDGTIPKQLALVVLHGKLSVRNLQAKRAPATDGGSRK